MPKTRDTRDKQKMKKINFENPAVFEKLEHMAYENTLDYTDFPPAEYKYFDKLSQLGSSYRSGQLPKGLCKELKESYLCDYRKDAEMMRKNLEAEKHYQECIRKSDELRCKINSTFSRELKLMYALRYIELMTGEEGFEERNMKEREENA